MGVLAHIHKGRFTAELDGDFVVFALGMRINKPWHVRAWTQVALAMPPMLKELEERPELGCLGSEKALMFGGPAVFQYWRSFEALEAYARARDSNHLPAWKEFNRRTRDNGNVGIWHETYKVEPGAYETIYGNMPAVGLGKVGDLRPLGSTTSAARRIGERPDDVPALPGY